MPGGGWKLLGVARQRFAESLYDLWVVTASFFKCRKCRRRLTKRGYEHHRVPPRHHDILEHVARMRPSPQDACSHMTKAPSTSLKFSLACPRTPFPFRDAQDLQYAGRRRPDRSPPQQMLAPPLHDFADIMAVTRTWPS